MKNGATPIRIRSTCYEPTLDDCPGIRDSDYHWCSAFCLCWPDDGVGALPDRHPLYAVGPDRVFQPDAVSTADHPVVCAGRQIDGSGGDGHPNDWYCNQSGGGLSRLHGVGDGLRLHALCSPIRLRSSHHGGDRVSHRARDEERRLRRALCRVDHRQRGGSGQSHPAFKPDDYLRPCL